MSKAMEAWLYYPKGTGGVKIVKYIGKEVTVPKDSDIIKTSAKKIAAIYDRERYKTSWQNFSGAWIVRNADKT